jgi:hypothetical protein
LCIDSIRDFTVLGMASLIVHENVHRLDIFREDEGHAVRFRDVHWVSGAKRGPSGECTFPFNVKPTALMLKNCDSYACFGAQSFKRGFFDRP